MPPEPTLMPFPIERSTPTHRESPKEASKEVSEENDKRKRKEESVSDPQIIPTPAPYPNRLKALAKPNYNAELHELFNQVKINISLMDAVKQIPSYAKFLKDLCAETKLDFVILDTNSTGSSAASTPVIPRRSFLATADAVINCRNGLLNMTFGNMKMEVNIFNVGSQMGDDENIHEVSLIDTLVEEHVDELLYSDPLEVALTAEEAEFLKSFEVNYLYSLLKDEDEVCAMNSWIPKFEEFEELPPIEKKVLPSSVEPPKLELKPLPDTLKHVFLGDNETYPVVISSSLGNLRETKLINLLRRHMKAIGWTIADIKVINSTFYSHHIALEDNIKPSHQPQHRFNPIMKDVVRAEVLKLLDVGIIYPIVDSKWVSPIQVVPKKFGVKVMRNEENELVPTRVQKGWRVCIDYRKLNASTRKDHFPLPFIDQILERIAGHAFYCFLDGYSGYN
ncbi:uncharacterized protein LOC131302954 [Rhododendron vialii]|uniref:uncharacterized protein LOC131302954 n=1 Tax=Rhododendron vialii TaxID=182163 RepID=UPI00265ECFCC|nr:uncharacterized protein LOC131302954 [Rhododendron vialii]